MDNATNEFHSYELEIERLREQVIINQTTIENLNKLCTYHENNGIAMVEQLAACQLDAERYCWLRDQMSEQQYRWFIEETPQENWDTAIDKAIAAMKEQRT